MSALARLQVDFQAHLLSGGGAALAHVLGTARVPVETRLAIYARAYSSRLAEALASNYPVLAKLLGEADFDTLASAYVSAHESSCFSIRYYGGALAEFLTTHPDYAAAPVLAELARWEWTMTEVFDAADATPLAHAELARIEPQQWAALRFSFHPSLRRLSLSWNAPQTWQALTGDAERPPASLSGAPVQWLLWRQGLSTYFRSLAATEAAVLDAAREGWPFGELCGLLCEELGDEAEAAGSAATLLRDWVGSGLITGAA
ncbi:MAG TPA: DNA-binding domain-containing protein [Steroidobacteraceae bacterium]|nr:DNA-binding domain-containing protein [Steroidobacteraceae bacterium]